MPNRRHRFPRLSRRAEYQAVVRKKVALLVETSSSHARQLIRGISEYVQRHEPWLIELHEYGPLSDVPGWLKNWKGDGMIARLESSAIKEAVLAKGVPLVNVSGTDCSREVPHVDTDNRDICSLAVEYFRKRGYTHFAYCGDNAHEWSVWRKNFIGRRLKAERLAFYTFELDAEARNRDELICWLRTLPKQTALIACNDHYGRMILGACVDAELNIPEDVAVLGIDNDEIICNLCFPSLSSVVPNTEQIGFLAAKTLNQMFCGRKTPREQLVKPLSICTRRSTEATAVSDGFVSRALQFIHSHATGSIGVNDVVRQTQTSRRFLEQRFRQTVGRPIHAEIARVRFETSQRLLTTTTLSIKEIASQSGFVRPDYLSAVFQKKLGMSPRDYRNRFARHNP